jgi:hypothetical protein
LKDGREVGHYIPVGCTLLVVLLLVVLFRAYDAVQEWLEVQREKEANARRGSA